MFVLAVIIMLAAFPFSAGASYAWDNYHWARTSNPFTLSVINSMTTDWDDNLNVAVSDWNSSSVMNVVQEAGSDDATTRQRCRAVKGKVRSCNYTYGINGWLGLAQIWVRGSHITQGTAKMNDTYLAASAYDETARQHVICQEIGHVWGLGHQDESGADLNTCMDYADALANPSPNTHDYAQLEQIYAHLDSSTTIGSAPAGFENANVHAQENWGTKVHESANGRSAIIERDFGNGFKIFTFVVWPDSTISQDTGSMITVASWTISKYLISNAGEGLSRHYIWLPLENCSLRELVHPGRVGERNPFGGAV